MHASYLCDVILFLRLILGTTHTLMRIHRVRRPERGHVTPATAERLANPVLGQQVRAQVVPAA